MKTKALILGLCLMSMAAQAQTTYAIDQPLEGKITRLIVQKGWDVHMVRDSKNMISILTPCEYYFAEGNEPQICKQHADGMLEVWENRSMPQGTVVELHVKDQLEELTLYANARLTADTIVFDEDFAHLTLEQGATLKADCVRCLGEYATIRVKQEGQAHIALLSSPHLTTLRTLPNATLMVDSLDCPEVEYYRNPKATDNLSTNTANNLTVKTRNRWYREADFNGSVEFNFVYNTSLYPNRYNSPYASFFDFDISVPTLQIKPVHINWTSPWAVSWGWEYGLHINLLQNTVRTQNHLLVIDNAENNRNCSYWYFYTSLPLNLHYIPRNEMVPIADLRVGLRPTLIFGETFFNNRTTTDNRTHSTTEHIRDINHFNIRLDASIRLRYFEKLEFGFFVDLLPTYRNGTSLNTHHNLGLYIRY